mgnify:FL=1
MPRKLPDPPAQTLLWRRLDQPGLERASLVRTPDGDWRFSGTVLTVENGAPLELRYVLLCDKAWATRYASVETRGQPDGPRYLQLLAMDDGSWQFRTAPSREAAIDLPFQDLPLPDDCADVDFEFSPLTNILPLRRLRLRPGQAADVVTLWVRVPDLRIETLEQRYHLRAAGQVQYEAAGEFQAAITIDRFGFVIRYDDLWERIAETVIERSTG